MPDALSPGDRALALLKTLLEHGGWYISAIELETHDGPDIDGEQYEQEAREILADAGIAVPCECGCGARVAGGLIEYAHPDDSHDERG